MGRVIILRMGDGQVWVDSVARPTRGTDRESQAILAGAIAVGGPAPAGSSSTARPHLGIGAQHLSQRGPLPSRRSSGD